MFTWTQNKFFRGLKLIGGSSLYSWSSFFIYKKKKQNKNEVSLFLLKVLCCMEKSLHPLKGVAKMERSGRRADRNQTLSRQLRSLVPALSYCPDAEPPLNVSGDLLSAEYATGHRVFVCLLAFRSGGAINTTQLMCSRSEGCSGFHLSQPP